MSQHFLLSIKALFFADRNAGGETILVQPTTFGGCAQYTPHVGYVADRCDPSPSIKRLILPVLGVDVSHRITDYLCITQGTSRCYCLDKHTRL
jgi:hypothetical protein